MQPRFILIKSFILDAIEDGKLKPGDKVPSENQLSADFSVSRMTARRAVSELVDEGILLRSQGLGSFVSDHRPMSSMLEIRSINDEIEHRGHTYSSQVVCLEAVSCDSYQSTLLGVKVASDIFHSKIVHFENDIAVQLEDRFVNPLWAAEYLQQDFRKMTANQYLSKVAPLTQADHSIEAILPDENTASLLSINIEQACLKITRRTFSAKGIVSYARLYHPGHRYRLGGHLDFNL
jgi:GntR family histidine utilization transcriptional repressor